MQTKHSDKAKAQCASCKNCTPVFGTFNDDKFLAGFDPCPQHEADLYDAWENDCISEAGF